MRKSSAPPASGLVNNSRKSRYWGLERWRFLSQISGLAITNLYFLHLRWLPCPVMNCYACPLATFACPIGSLQYAIDVGFFPFYLLGIIFLSGLVFGRITCGWLCPFGFIQDLLYKIPTRKFSLPKYLSYGKYFFLAIFVLLLPFIFHQPIFCKICPVGTLQGGIPWPIIEPQFRSLIGWNYFLKIAILVGIIILSILFSRPFCRVMCPLGALLSFFNRFSFLRVEVKSDACRHCALCTNRCPQGIAIYEEEGHPDCIGCLKCKVCNAIEMKAGLPEKLKGFKEG
ncbi:4Fe-4S binding protein [bacterium]|nr:4Fe-4S binding protein [bacterium]